MPNYYEISPADDTLTLQDGKGSASVAVRYIGDRNVEARASAEPTEGAEKRWLRVEPPQQRKMGPGQTQTFKVTVAVPPGTAPGRYGVRLDVVSVANPDEEYDRGSLITFRVERVDEPPRASPPQHSAPLRVHIKREIPRWKMVWMIIVTVVMIAWFGFVAWQMITMDDLFDDFPIEVDPPMVEPL